MAHLANPKCQMICSSQTAATFPWINIYRNTNSDYLTAGGRRVLRQPQPLKTGSRSIRQKTFVSMDRRLPLAAEKQEAPNQSTTLTQRVSSCTRRVAAEDDKQRWSDEHQDDLHDSRPTIPNGIVIVWGLPHTPEMWRYRNRRGVNDEVNGTMVQCQIHLV